MVDEHRVIGDDIACPVEIQPGVDYATPEDWTWRTIGTSLPNRATFHLTHSDVSRVIVDVLRPSDSPTDGQFVLAQEVPVIVLDSLDKYWAAESRTKLPLNGIRVPVEGDTIGEAKKALAADLAAQLRLLLLLSSSHKGRIAPALLENMRYLSSCMDPGPGTSG